MTVLDCLCFQKGKPIDFFMLIIEGRIEANVGKEELIFESGPFTYFGLQVSISILIYQNDCDNKLHCFT